MRKEEKERVNAIVTGAGGWFGKRVVDDLLKDGGYNVHCLDLYIPPEEERNKLVCSYIQGSICNYEDVLLSLQGVKAEAVFHVSNFNPFHSIPETKASFYKTNVTGTETVIKACQQCKVKRLVYTSSATVVMKKGWTQLNVDETAPYPKSPLSKYSSIVASAERLVLDASGKNGLLTCAMRLAPIICSTQDPNIQSLLTRSAFLVKGANHGMSIVSATAAAKAHILAEKQLRSGITSVAGGKAYNLGNKERILYRDFYGKLGSSGVTIWGQSPPTEISKGALMIMACINHYWFKYTGSTLVHENLSPSLLDILLTEQSFCSERACCELDWGIPPWQDIVYSLVRDHKAGQVKKGKLC